MADPALVNEIGTDIFLTNNQQRVVFSHSVNEDSWRLPTQPVPEVGHDWFFPDSAKVSLVMLQRLLSQISVFVFIAVV